jgi:hypothetical protein
MNAQSTAQMHNPVNAPEHAQMHTPLGGAVCVQTVGAQVHEPKPSDLLLATFGGKGSGMWIKTTRGERCVPADFPKPDWLDDPKHTAAEMGPAQWNAVDQPERVQVARQRRVGR